MVRLINEKNMEFFADLVYFWMHIQEGLTHIKGYNTPTFPCIYAMWHKNQFAIYGIEDKPHTNIQVSTSIDGELVARAIQKMGFRVVRGSAGRKGAVESTMQMIKRLKEGESVGIMIDGPHGPLYKVKNGVIKLAQKTGMPIIPLHWYSSQLTFVTFPSWDKMKSPFGDCKILNVYGDPIYVKEDATEEEIEAAKANLKQQLFDLEAKAPALYKEARKNKLWDK